MSEREFLSILSLRVFFCIKKKSSTPLACHRHAHTMYKYICHIHLERERKRLNQWERSKWQECALLITIHLSSKERNPSRRIVKKGTVPPRVVSTLCCVQIIYLYLSCQGWRKMLLHIRRFWLVRILHAPVWRVGVAQFRTLKFFPCSNEGI